MSRRAGSHVRGSRRRAARLDPRRRSRLDVPPRRLGDEGARAVTPACPCRLRGERGFVATEFALGIALLIVPVACLVLTLPTWSERRTTARAIVREVARVVASAGVCDQESARGLTQTMARNLGLPGWRRNCRAPMPAGRPARAGERARSGGHGADARGRRPRSGRGRGVGLDREAPPTRRPVRELVTAVVRPRPVDRERGTITLWILGLCLMLFL